MSRQKQVIHSETFVCNSRIFFSDWAYSLIEHESKRLGISTDEYLTVKVQKVAQQIMKRVNEDRAIA